MNFIDHHQGTPVSVKIRERLAAARQRYHGNDNIAEFIQPGELDQLLDEVAGALRILEVDTAPDYLEAVRRFTETELLQQRQLPVEALHLISPVISRASAGFGVESSCTAT